MVVSARPSRYCCRRFGGFGSVTDKAIGIDEMRPVAGQFRIGGTVTRAEPYGTGHINDTYAVYFEDAPRERYIFQRINHRIFPDVPRLMDNIARVTAHIRRKLERVPGSDLERGTLTVIPLKSGASFLQTGTGDCWRAYIFIEGATTHDVLKDKRQAYEAARTFGAFQGMLADLPAPPLHETIPHFHNTARRMSALKEAVKKDAAGRGRSAADEIRFALEREAKASIVVDMLAKGALPARVTHNDTKINNVMIDDATGRGVCAIDLDTVMAGSALYDFGDMVRTAAATSAEDETDLSKAGVSMELFGELVRGYLESAGGFLCGAELERLAFSARLITFTIGIRFLTDFLAGDVYFKVRRPNHNLDRARVQFRMVETMEKREEEMREIVREHLSAVSRQ